MVSGTYKYGSSTFILDQQYSLCTAFLLFSCYNTSDVCVAAGKMNETEFPQSRIKNQRNYILDVLLLFNKLWKVFSLKN